MTLMSCRQSANTEHTVVIVSDSAVVSTTPTIQEDTYAKSFITGHFNPETHESFSRIDMQYADRENMYMQKEAYDAFVRMWKAARNDGIKLVIKSAARNFVRQKEIWESKWKGERLNNGTENLAETTPDPVERANKILQWSSMPGTSRHHWGTDIDLNDFTNAYFEQGYGREVYDWLFEHASGYGYCQVYTEKGPERPYGYNEEKWHWSYIPLASLYTEYARHYLVDNDINGFKGAETAGKIGIKQNYILGISKICL